MKSFLIICCMLSGLYSGACLNYYFLDERGHSHEYAGEKNPGYIYVDKEIAKTLQRRQQAILKADKNNKFYAIADYAATLIRAGCSEDALPILHRLLKERAGEYNLYANLAVAYELLGHPDTALVYLNKSLQLNPYSHNGSEWFHKSILEYAVNQKGNGSDFSAGQVLKINNAPAEKVIGDIAYQLSERVPLTPAPNELLSKAIEESADYYRKNVSLELAIKYYAVAIAYAADKSRAQELSKRTEVLMPKLFEMHRKKKNKLLFFSQSKWKTQFAAIISEWRNYQPYRYDGELMDISYEGISAKE